MDPLALSWRDLGASECVPVLEIWNVDVQLVNYHVGRRGNEIDGHFEKVPEGHTARFVIQK